MKRLLSRLMLFAAALLIAAQFDLGGSRQAQAQIYDPYGPRITWYNLYADGGSDVVALAYPSPRPVPPWVGYTYITYPPLAPHEFLYQHTRRYVRPSPFGGRNVTRVIWW